MPRSHAPILTLSFGVFLVALLARLVVVPQVVEAGDVLTTGPESAFHLRRIQYVAQNFPHVPTVDPWSDAPYGTLIVNPPGLDLIVAGVALAVGGGEASPKVVGWVAAGLVPLLGAFLAFLAIALARRLLNPTWSVWVGLMIALWPGHAIATSLGRFDQHAVAPLITGLVWLFWLRSGERRTRFATIVDALIGGGILASGLVLWSQSFAALAITMTMVWIQMILIPPDTAPARTPRSRRVLIFFGTAAALAWPLGLASPHGAGGGQTVHATSVLHPILLTVGCLSLAIGAWFQERFSATGAPRWSLMVHQIWPTLLALAGLMATSPVLLEAIDLFLFPLEAAPILGRPDGLRALWHLDIETFMSLHGLIWLFLPIGTALVATRAFRSPQSEAAPGRALMVGGAVMFGIMGTMQQAFLPLAAMPFAVIMIAASETVWAFLRGRLAFQLTTAVIATVAFLASSGFLVSPEPRAAGHDAIFAGYDWLRESTPEPLGAWDPNTPVQWSVAAPWPLGHELAYHAKRPVVASLLVGPAHELAARDGYRLLLSASASEVRAIVEARRIRYLWVTPEPRLEVERIAEVLSIPAWQLFEPRPSGGVRASQKLRGTLWFQALTLPSAGSPVQIAGFELRWESPQRSVFANRPTPLIRIYEWLGDRN